MGYPINMYITKTRPLQSLEFIHYMQLRAHFTKIVIKLDSFGKIDTKTLKKIMKIVKFELFLEVSGDHLIPLKSRFCSKVYI